MMIFLSLFYHYKADKISGKKVSWGGEDKDFGDDELKTILKLDESWKEEQKAKEYERDFNKVSLSFL